MASVLLPSCNSRCHQPLISKRQSILIQALLCAKHTNGARSTFSHSQSTINRRLLFLAVLTLNYISTPRPSNRLMFLITLLLVRARNAIGQNLCVGRLFLPFNFLSGIYTFAPNTLSYTKVVDRLNTGVLNDRHWILITPFNMPIMAS